MEKPTMTMQDIQLDAMKLLQRVAQINPDLYARVVAEAQRDALLEAMNEAQETSDG